MDLSKWLILQDAMGSAAKHIGQPERTALHSMLNVQSGTQVTIGG
jgi:hypothetical protein